MNDFLAMNNLSFPIVPSTPVEEAAATPTQEAISSEEVSVEIVLAYSKSWFN